MNASTLEKVYSPADVEARWYAHWEKHGFFHAQPRADKPAYTIVIPPPNVTGVLHMGHILNNTLQDAFIRYRRMTGNEACWIPGTDHAGIATQNVVERALVKEGKTRHDLGREKFVERVWEWRKQYGGVIIRQLRTLGTSCDWQREKFTMDESLSAAVREVFVRLFEEGLIYRGKYIVNWCPKDHTAISDDEVNFAEENGKLYYVRYPLSPLPGEKGAPQFISVATTRPETMLGDTAVAVNPEDDRYRALVGRTLVLPLVGRNIPIVADSFVDPAFGTGMVKVTPAHDPNDYWIGQRHHLPQINIFDISACLNDEVPARYRGKDRKEGRTLVVEDLEREGLLERVEDHVHNVGHCYRCNTAIEPYLSDQWFVRMKPLAEPALAAVQDGLIRFYPDRWHKVYENWMTNIRDWCISRQLWWGHRIPVWYCDNATCPDPIVRRSAPDRCPRCGGTTLRQDEDVLDTWFSSWLWPFSVHDWPAQEAHGTAADLRYFYPTDTLVTAPDIIFFWVARMIMAGLKFGPSFTGSTKPADNIPFRHVYFTSTVRDARGRKMSKSLGNSPEPLDLIAEYGADAVRFTIMYLAPLGQDVLYSAQKNEMGRNFANKIWNAGRFLLMNKEQIGEIPPAEGAGTLRFSLEHGDLADRWILSRFHSTTKDIHEGYEAYEINKVSKTIYDFFWHDFCDWYLEMVKSRLYGDEPVEVKRIVLGRALDIFDGALRLLHPLMPFVTEELWQHVRTRRPDETIMFAQIPPADTALIDRDVEEQMGFVQKLIESLRNIRGEMSIPPARELTLLMRVNPRYPEKVIRLYEGYLQRLARVTSVQMHTAATRPHLAASLIVDGAEFYVPLAGLIDIERERLRLSKETARIGTLVESIQKKLANADFLGRAPQDVVAQEKEKAESLERNLSTLQRHLEELT